MSKAISYKVPKTKEEILEQEELIETGIGIMQIKKKDGTLVRKPFHILLTKSRLFPGYFARWLDWDLVESGKTENEAKKNLDEIMASQIEILIEEDRVDEIGLIRPKRAYFDIMRDGLFYFLANSKPKKISSELNSTKIISQTFREPISAT